MMTRMQIYLPEDMFIQLKQKAHESNLSMADLVRRSLLKILPTQHKNLKKNLDPLKHFVGCIKGGSKTNAVQDIYNLY